NVIDPLKGLWWLEKAIIRQRLAGARCQAAGIIPMFYQSGSNLSKINLVDLNNGFGNFVWQTIPFVEGYRYYEEYKISEYPTRSYYSSVALRLIEKIKRNPERLDKSGRESLIAILNTIESAKIKLTYSGIAKEIRSSPEFGNVKCQ